jgi:prephenate dehydrogenase
MKVGVVGLGLIGGSVAKAYKAAGHTVYGYDVNATVLGYAKLDGTIEDELSPATMKRCDLILLAATPGAVISYLVENAKRIAASTLVIDFCGTKRAVCAEGFNLAAQHGFTFVGGHPMAGLQYSGYKHSRATLFSGASFIMVPAVHDNIVLLDKVKQALAPLGFKKFVITTADFHDRMIAYTSQMCHVVSNAFVKSPSAQYHKGYSAGSFRDLTRVSRLNEDMWAELFIENRENLLTELDSFINSLSQYREAIASGSADALRALLHEGCEAKKNIE